MKKSFSRLLLASLATVVLTSFAMAPFAEAAARGDGGGGGGGGGGARAGGGGGGGARGGGGDGARAQGGGGARQTTQVNNSKADVRTNNVRNTSVNNVNVQRNNNVVVAGNAGCCGGWDNDYHPVAATAAVVGTAAVIGAAVRSVPPGCAPVNYGGVVYQQCGGTWYQPQGSQFVVVNPPY